jgi:hypothetical protein
MIDTRGHYIKENQLSRVPRRWVYLDCEADVDYRAGAQFQSWRLGVVCLEHRDNRKRQWTAPVWATHHDTRELWTQISDFTRPEARTIVVAHNIGYDLRISRAIFELLDLGWHVDQMSVGGRNLTMTFRRDKASLLLVDSTSWLPQSLAKVALMMGRAKLDLPNQDDSDEAWEARCVRDVELLRDFSRVLIDWIDRDDLGNWQKTGAGMAWATWRHAHYTHPVLVHDDAEARAAEVEALHTGRCEAWRHGTLAATEWAEYDLPLAYPRIAQSTELPTRLQGHVIGPTVEWFNRRREHARLLVRATVTTTVPVLPWKGSDGHLWPVGTFTGWWWDCELALAMAWGTDVALHHACVYASAPALASWATWVIGITEDDTGRYSEVQKAMAKHWSRALIGRFGAKFPLWVDWCEAPNPGVNLSTFLDCDTRQAGRELTLGNRSYIATESEYIADAAPAVLGYVMAEARVRLWHLVEVAGAANVAYMDTDSLVINHAGQKRLDRWVRDGNGWGVRRKARWRTLKVLGPRQLIINGHGRIAGVPSTAKLRHDGRWHGEKWDGVETTLASPTPDVVRVRDAKWTVTGTDRRRLHLPGGSTAPIEVDAAEAS